MHKNVGVNNPRWRGGRSCGYIKKVATTILKKVGRNLKVCELCKSKKNVEIHHTDKNRKNNRSENLRILCRSCHKRVELNSGKYVNCAYCNKQIWRKNYLLNTNKRNFCSLSHVAKFYNPLR